MAVHGWNSFLGSILIREIVTKNTSCFLMLGFKQTAEEVRAKGQGI